MAKHVSSSEFRDNAQTIEFDGVSGVLGTNAKSYDELYLRANSGLVNGPIGKGSDAEDDEEEAQRKKEEKLAERNLDNSIDALQNAVLRNTESYKFSTDALAISTQYNAHSIDMLPGAQLDAAKAKEEADKKLAGLNGAEITAADGTKIHLDKFGDYVDAQGHTVDKKVLDTVDWQDPEAAEMKVAKDSMDNSKTKAHTASFRAHAASEQESMIAYNKMEQEKLEQSQKDLAKKQEEITQSKKLTSDVSFVEDNSPKKTDIKLNSSFSSAADGANKTDPQAAPDMDGPSATPKLGFNAPALKQDLSGGPRAPAGMGG